MWHIRCSIVIVLNHLQTRQASRHAKKGILKIGYVPMTDCAPLVIAKEFGYFEKYGLNVELSREPGWATIREKIRLGELDAAQAPASMVMELSFGLGGVTTPCLTGFVTAHNGNAITLSNQLWELGVRDGHSLAEFIKNNPRRKLTFAGVLQYSSQNYLIRHWLLAHGINPEEDVNIVVVPPPLVHDCLKNGFLDGYCVAEPWSSLGLLEGVGWCTTLSSDFISMHPEKVFMVKESFHDQDPGRHIALLKALSDAAVYCDKPKNREELAKILSQPNYVNVSIESLKNALVGPFSMGMGRHTTATEAIVFHNNDANRPSLQKAAWVLDEIVLHKIKPDFVRPNREEVMQCFREDIYEALIH